jgi:DNA repair exonuclease SbcCD nuclease subunit
MDSPPPGFVSHIDTIPRGCDSDRPDAAWRIGDVAKEGRLRVVVVTGDILESNQDDPRTAIRALEAERAVEVPVYLLPGNLDARMRNQSSRL